MSEIKAYEDWVYDCETFRNQFLLVAYQDNMENVQQFEVSPRKDERAELYAFLNTPSLRLIGYNNLGFDYPVIHYILTDEYLFECSVKDWVHSVKKRANNIIESMKSDNRGIKFKYSIWEKDILIPQIDLFKLNGFDKNFVSLKALEFAMRFENVQDLPYAHDKILTQDEMQVVADYCHNDVRATYKFFKLNANAIKFREIMSKKLGKNLLSTTDVGIGELVNLRTYERLSGRKFSEFKKQRTHHEIFHVKDLIPDFIKFETPYLQEFLAEIKTASFTPEEDFLRVLTFGGITVNIMKGGIHSHDKACVISVGPNEKFKEKDVGSMYPASLINGKLFPAHLGEEWVMGIKESFEKRAYELKPLLKTLEKGSDKYDYVNSEQEAYKLSMNGGGYGKTGSKFNWQYDEMVMMKTTIKGQLAILMLMEQFQLNGITMTSANTDGVNIIYDKKLDDIVENIHKEWENTTDYILEDTNYKRIVSRNVNNYFAEIINDEGETVKYKLKGVFEIDKQWHKDHSMRIVPIAIANYFINGISLKQTIWNHHKRKDYPELCLDNGKPIKAYGIYDFCKRVKIQGKDTLLSTNYKDNELVPNVEQKMTRFYISNEGRNLVKLMPPLDKKKGDMDKYRVKCPDQFELFDIDDYKVLPERESRIEAGETVTMFNRYLEKDFEEYDIKLEYFLEQAEKIINEII
jgi:hypothetical protein